MKRFLRPDAITMLALLVFWILGSLSVFRPFGPGFLGLMIVFVCVIWLIRGWADRL